MKKFLLIYICNFHVLNNFLLIFICKLHWNCIKNRFGSTAEIGVYTMEPNGLEDVLNPSALFMSPAVVSTVNSF